MDDRRAVDREAYVPGLALPTEPSVPGRFRRLGIVVTAIVIFVAAGYGVFRVATAGESFDPALDGNRVVDPVEDAVLEDPALQPSESG